ncbi:MAG: class I SAM-dependent methyltransferase [Gammaproteobacteria bacterium]|nr:class I SAM-dependent methyltransferase [Gammaproteobacteria bacterium]
MSDKNHWEGLYAEQEHRSLSWYQDSAHRSLKLIERFAPAKTSAIIDIGGGASVLSAELLQRDYCRLSVLDISHAALAVARARLGERADLVDWLEKDIGSADLARAGFDLWHDRAVFHFMVDEAARRAYVDCALNAVRPSGHLIIATFAEDGPEQCSGLPVARYDATLLAAQFGAACTLIHSETETHRTPTGRAQHFRYCVLCRGRE